MNHKTTVYDPTASLPPAARDHVRECAREMGIDHCQYHSCEQTIKLPDGRACEVWYDEDSSSPYAWRAFVAGVGTKNGASREEAIAAHGAGRG